MFSSSSEKVGVVIIHGVGETHEGWIDTYLVPELEKWAAFNNVGALDRKDPTNELLLVLPAEDQHIVVSLGEDKDFKSFCWVTGLDPYADLPQYRTRDARVANLDDLTYQISMVVGLQTANEWLTELHQAGVPSALAFEPESEVHRVRDPGSSDPTRTWQSYTRQLNCGPKQAIFTELFWADMSKVGDTSLDRMSALTQLFLESPFVLGKAFLKGSDGGIHSVIRWLVRTANWLLNWPVAGLNVAVFLTAFVVMAKENLGYSDYLIETVGGSLAFIVVAGYMSFRNLVHRKVGLAFLALSGAFYAALLLGALIAATYWATPATLADPGEYLIAAVLLILLAWAGWTATTVLAIILISAVWLKRRLSPAKPDAPKIERSAAALSLSLILGMIWKLLLALLGIMVINVLVKGVGLVGTTCKDKGVDVLTKADVPCALAYIKALLIDVNAINSLSILAFAVAFMIVAFYRWVLVKYRGAKAGALPRLIASPFVIGVLFASAVANAIVIYLVESGNIDAGNWLREWMPRNQAEFFSFGVIGIIFFFYAIRRIAERTDGIVHMGRDLVDHQYDPSPSTLSMIVQPRRAGRGRKPIDLKARFQRRLRIQRRLEALIDEVIVGQQVDRLIFVAHSQGSVIMHDYLLNHDNLVAKTHDATNTLTTVKRIDALTIGSPLGHIYQHYFDDYDQPKRHNTDNPPLIHRVHSWTNMFRVDDPIGHEVNIIEGIENLGLGTGGHMYYWREDAFCEKLWSLIIGPGEAITPAPGTAAGTPTVNAPGQPEP